MQRLTSHHAQKLTPQETKAAELFAAGNDEKQIAAQMGITHQAVLSYLSRCRLKTNSPTNRALYLLFAQPEQFKKGS